MVSHVRKINRRPSWILCSLQSSGWVLLQSIEDQGKFQNEVFQKSESINCVCILISVNADSNHSRQKILPIASVTTPVISVSGQEHIYPHTFCRKLFTCRLSKATLALTCYLAGRTRAEYWSDSLLTKSQVPLCQLLHCSCLCARKTMLKKWEFYHKGKSHKMNRTAAWNKDFTERGLTLFLSIMVFPEWQRLMAWWRDWRKQWLDLNHYFQIHTDLVEWSVMASMESMEVSMLFWSTVSLLLKNCK